MTDKELHALVARVIAWTEGQEDAEIKAAPTRETYRDAARYALEDISAVAP